jgi:hydrogenase maturation protein HypF
VGGELKSTVCLLDGGEAVMSEHLGDLTRPETFRHFVRAVDRLKELCGFEPQVVACDLHPRYLATEYAGRLGLPVVAVQHHHAHIGSVMAEWGEAGPVIGLACDGTGFGSDRAVWGCEVLLCERGGYQRLGHLEYFPLVGGDAGAIETWRPAAALLRAACGEAWVGLVSQAAELCGCGPSAEELRVFELQAARAINAPPTSSLGRAFDAVSFLLGLCGRNRHEAEAAMTLEAAAAGQPAVVEPLGYEVRQADDGLRLSLLAGIRELVELRGRGEPVPRLAARFHETVARLLAEAANLASQQRGVGKVALSGGCFVNRRLLTRLVGLLEASGLQVLYHRQVPCGDGGLALGQALVAAWLLAETPLSGPP